MRHAPVAAARVIFAPSVAAARKAVAGEYEQVLQPLVALPRRGHRRYRRAGPPVARRQPAVRGQPVVAWEVGYVYGYDQLGCRSRPYAGHREQAPVRLVGGKQRRYLGGQRPDLGVVLRYPSREQPDGAVLAGDGRRVRPARRLDGSGQRRHLGAPAAARERPDGLRRGLGYRPWAADGGHELEGRRVREVGLRLEFRARLEQYAAEPVLAARVLAGQKVPLRGERPGGLYLGRPVGHRKQRVGYAQRRLGYDHRVALVGLGVSGEQPRGAVRGEPGQVRARHPGELGARKRERADVADLVDDDQRARVLSVEPVDGVFPVGDGPACQELALARDDARPVRRFPDVEPYDDPRPGGWCHGGILQSVGRSEALPSTPTLPGRGLRARQFPISRSERRASSVATPPPGPRGAGADGHPGTPDRRPLGAWPNCRPCAE